MGLWRVLYQFGQLVAAGADLCGLDCALFHELAEDGAWQYVYPPHPGQWVYGATLC